MVLRIYAYVYLFLWVNFALGFSGSKLLLKQRGHNAPSRIKCRRFMASDNMERYDDQDQPRLRVVVVGGGVGGLAVAARIAATRPFCDVTIYEKNEEIGGRSGSFDVNIPNVGTFRHERGPSLLLLPHVYQEVFQDCLASASTSSSSSSSSGEQLAQEFGLVMRQCTPSYQVVFDEEDNSSSNNRLDVGFSKQLCQKDERIAKLYQESRQKMDQLEPNGAEKWDEYMRATAAFLDCGLPNFIEERLDLGSFPAFIYEALRDFGKAWPLKPHSDVLDAIFDSEKMRALASFQDLYVGLEPYRNNQQLGAGVLTTTAPAVFGLLAAIELHPDNDKAGVFAPIGGFKSVSESLANLARAMGVTIETGRMVTRIDSSGVVHVRRNDTDTATTGSTNTDSFVSADLVIVNADLPYASKSLLLEQSAKEDEQDPSAEPRFDWDDSFLFSSGVVAFHWSIDKELHDLNTHNVFLAAAKGRERAEESWRILRGKEGGSKVEPFNFYVHCPTKTDPSAAPEGCDSIMVLVPCPTLERKPEFATLSRDEAIEEYKKQFDKGCISALREAVLKRFAAIDSLADLEDHILDEVVDTPSTYADQYHVGAGTPFALSHGFGQLSLTRPGAKFGLKQDSNILYCGASSRPGNGVPLVLLGSKLVADKAQSLLDDMLCQR
ncbi:Dehydrosqualene desaturase [Seminavis robusta]|uniref:Dehydrosqualene desaturase n=1 Tax=Seminavis robusta TaxID=568900 RepID=A0A9N8F4F5_9STRA|nr:Dehydrosqualene desaturase [Seminavis robusta]|eukprot:Sro2948_g340820.1 Dehydrosqualene desaturase (664) ;mRNA; f:253-2442